MICLMKQMYKGYILTLWPWASRDLILKSINSPYSWNFTEASWCSYTAASLRVGVRENFLSPQTFSDRQVKEFERRIYDMSRIILSFAKEIPEESNYGP